MINKPKFGKKESGMERMSYSSASQLTNG